jgi:drug/metabolite transporter (DMT)-like permease
VRARRSLTTYVALVYGVAALTLLAFVAAGRLPLAGFSPAAYGWLLALGLGSQLIGHSTLNWALRHLSATFVSVLTLVEPVGSGLLAYLVLGEEVMALTLAGGALVLAGVYVASRAEMRALRGLGRER